MVSGRLRAGTSMVVGTDRSDCTRDGTAGRKDTEDHGDHYLNAVQALKSDNSLCLKPTDANQTVTSPFVSKYAFHGMFSESCIHSRLCTVRGVNPLCGQMVMRPPQEAE